jgi:hypothetical protein
MDSHTALLPYHWGNNAVGSGGMQQARHSIHLKSTMLSIKSTCKSPAWIHCWRWGWLEQWLVHAMCCSPVRLRKVLFACDFNTI